MWLMTLHHKTRVKVCGITRAEDAMTAAALGVDAIGFVFYEKSPRAITPTAAGDIIQKLPPFLVKVGLFVNATPETVFSSLSSCAIDILQFHGHESVDFCNFFISSFDFFVNFE